MKTRVMLFDAFSRNASLLQSTVVERLLDRSVTCTITCGERPYLIGRSVEDLVSKISETDDHTSLLEKYEFVD